MDPKTVGQAIMAFGLLIIVIGAIVWSGAFSWFGRLPGDIRYENGSTRVYAPIVSGLLLSILVSAIMFVIRKLGGR